ncbi:MAG TPA: hypothetical protein VHD89_00990 [Rhodanobacteraceae bacterium]|jgi:hypothetical protein|nr:hypothetical protein [Rhodanobacteraceae bacterium]
MVETDDKQNGRLRREIRWDAVAAIIASLVGFLALLVAGYTAYIARYTANVQLKQVQAQVWPYLIVGNNDLTQSLVVDNKGMGPAIVRSVQVRIDGKPQRNWNQLVATLGMSKHHFAQTTVNQYVLSPGEQLQAIRFPDKDLWQQFHDAAMNRLSVDICYCSTLGECWVSRNGNVIGPASMALQLQVKQVDQCPRLPPSDVFNN